MHDLLLKNGLICDGTGTSPFVGDVSVRDGKIQEIAPHIDGESRETLDVTGLAVSPAFIDIHSHSDSWFRADGRCEAKLYQGVGTEVVGQCGSSPFPRNVSQMSKIRAASERGELSRMESYQAASFQKLREKVRQPGDVMSTNLVQMVGHNAIRRGVVGLMDRPAWEDEIKLSRFLLEENLEQGAWGLTLGLGYLPGMFADKHELEELAKTCYIYGVPLAVHMRDEGERVFESLHEMLDIARKTGVQLQISHLKLGAKSVWGRAEELHSKILRAREEGIRINADMYPYNACSTGISSRLPTWVMNGGGEAAARLLSTPGPKRDEVLALFREKYPTLEDGERFYVVSSYGHCPEADGKTLGQLSQLWGLPVPETMLRYLIETQCDEDAIIFNVDEKDVLWLLAQEDMVIGSDASCRPFDPAASDGKPHPRTYGTFPRFLRLCRDNKLCPLETAIRRITARPAEIIGLKDRGLLKVGMVADITVFDPATIGDNGTYDVPWQKPTGVHHVILRGEVAIRDGVQTQARLGDYLLKKA